MGRKAACPGYPNKGLAITEEKSAEVQRLQEKNWRVKVRGRVAVRSALINLAGDPKVEEKHRKMIMWQYLGVLMVFCISKIRIQAANCAIRIATRYLPEFSGMRLLIQEAWGDQWFEWKLIEHGLATRTHTHTHTHTYQHMSMYTWDGCYA